MKKTNFTPFYHPNCLQGGLKKLQQTWCYSVKERTKLYWSLQKKAWRNQGRNVFFLTRWLWK